MTWLSLFAAGAGQAVAADYYWDVNGTTAYGDGAGIFRASAAGTTWSTSSSGTSPLTFVIGSGVGTTQSFQFGFGTAPGNNTNGAAVTIGNNTSTLNQPTVGALIFNGSGTSGYTITNAVGNANVMSVTLTGSATNAIGSGTGILVNSNVSGDTTFGKYGGGTGGTGSNVSNVGTAGIILGRSQTWTNNSTSYSLIVNAPIAGAFALTTNGPGTIVLGGSNSFSGLNVSAGTLALGSSSALGTGNNLAVNGGTLNLKGRSVAVATLSGSSGGIITSSTTGAVTLTGSSASDSTYGGAIQDGSGTVSLVKQGVGALTLSGTNIYSGGTTVSAGSLVGTTSSLQGAITNNAAVTFDQATSGTYAGVMSGSGSLTKLGAGMVTLTGANTYTGATLVSAGKLLVNGSLANSTVTVGNDATLGGSGTLGGPVTVQSGGTLSPGNSPGLLTVSTLDLLAGSTTLMQIVGSGNGAGSAGTDYDKVVITTAGGLGYGGSLDLDFANTLPFADGTAFDLFGFTGAPQRHFSSVGSTGGGSYTGLTFTGVGGVWTALSGGQLLTFSELTGQLRFTLNSAPVPEIDPAGMGSVLALVTGALGLLERRRLKSKAA